MQPHYNNYFKNYAFIANVLSRNTFPLTEETRDAGKYIICNFNFVMCIFIICYYNAVK